MTAPMPGARGLAATTLAAWDAALESAYDDLARAMAGQPEAAVQQRFGEYCIFPALGWRLLAVGDAQALAAGDAGVLRAALARFACCAWACWGRLDADGLHPTSGQDHCARAVPAVLAAPLGDGWLRAAFPLATRPSAQGHAALRHAANVLTGLAHPAWPHAARTRAQAEAYQDGRGGNAADRAWVGFLLAVAARDAVAATGFWQAFAQAFTRTDWGRHKPATRPAFLHGMAALAGRHGAGPLDAAVLRCEVGSERAALWAEAVDAAQVDAVIPAANPATPPGPTAPFAGRLAFLNMRS